MDPLLFAILAEDDAAMGAAAFAFHALLFSFGVWFSLPKERNPSVSEQRLIWHECVERNVRRGAFRRALLMDKPSFDKLVLMLSEQMSVNTAMANLRGGPIVVELCLFCAVRHFAGGSHLDIVDTVGISVPSFCRIAWRTARALMRAEQLATKWPSTDEDVCRVASGFCSIGADSVTSNCVGAVDGCLLRIATPRKSEAKNVRSFFSGHCKRCGVNTQAAADHHSRFLHIAVAGPGVTGDRDAIKEVSLHGLAEQLPHGHCVIGDAACDASEHIVPMHDGADRLIVKRDDFNFCASQLRIQMEMAFGMMQSKWSVLQRPVACRLKNVLLVAQAVGCLHNCCINERLEANGDIDTEAMPLRARGDGTNLSCLPTEPVDSDGNSLQLGCHGERLTSSSVLREHMAQRVFDKGLKRPEGNKTKT